MTAFLPLCRTVAACCVLAAARVAAADLDVAFIGTFSGAKATTAQDELDGFRLAVRHLGGRLGGVEFSFSVNDDRRQIDLARQEAEDFLQSGKIKIMLLSSSAAVADVVAPLANTRRAIMVNLGQVSAALAGKDCQSNVFSVVVRAELLQELVGSYLQGQGFKQLTVVLSNDRRDALAAFRRGFKGEINEMVVRRGNMEFADETAKLKQAKTDAIYLLLSGGMAVNFLLQYSASGLKSQVPLFGAADLFDQTTLAASAPSTVGLFSVGSWSEDLDFPSNKRLLADFETDFGRPVSSRAAAGYDAAMLLDAAIRSLDRKINDIDNLRAALKRVDFASTRGTFRFDNNQFPMLNFWVRQVASDPRGRLINEQRGLLATMVRDSMAQECPMRAAPPPVAPAKKN
jgi:branched-chain amino acid transport system substrate-binding protein